MGFSNLTRTQHPSPSVPSPRVRGPTLRVLRSRVPYPVSTPQGGRLCPHSPGTSIQAQRSPKSRSTTSIAAHHPVFETSLSRYMKRAYFSRAWCENRRRSSRHLPWTSTPIR